MGSAFGIAQFGNNPFSALFGLILLLPKQLLALLSHDG